MGIDQETVAEASDGCDESDQMKGKGPEGPSRWLITLLSITAGSVVANLYYNQSLLRSIQLTYHASAAGVAGITTATQLGYALGLLLLVPLGDGINRKLLIVATTLLSSGALIAFAVSPNLPGILITSLAIGFISITPQLAIPYAALLVGNERRGRTIGTVMSGLLIGILFSRSISGFIGAHYPWQTVYFLAAGFMVLLSVVLTLSLPSQHPVKHVPYFQLLRSLPSIFATQPVLRRHALLGALGFASFSAFWTTLAFYLSSRPEHFGSDVVGIFGLVAVTGALVAPVAGRLAERLSARIVNSSFIAIILLSFVAMVFAGPIGLAALVIGVVLMDAGVQGNQITNQTRIYSLESHLHSRINSIYMVIYFIGGSIGSQIGAQAWIVGGWNGVCLVGGLFAALGLALLSIPESTSRHARRGRPKLV